MSIARKCDRCHNYYDPYYSSIKVVIDNNQGKAMDLCPTCQGQLEKWVKEYEFFDCVNEEAADGHL